METADIQGSEGRNNRTCYTYDETMAKHRNMFDEEHPEKAERIWRAYTRFKELGLSSRCSQIQAGEGIGLPMECIPLSLHGRRRSYARQFFRANCQLSSHFAMVHKLQEGIKMLRHWIASEEHIERMRELDSCSDEKLQAKAEDYDSIYFSKFTNECARMAAGCTLAVVEDVLAGNSRNGVAIVRPPGHHAERDFCMGYSYFNNVAIAAMIAKQKWNVKRILIVDWDIHHGNGTQHLFQSDPSVLYFSIHRYDKGNFWPEKEYSNFDFVGKEEGEGYNINIAWNKKHMNDADYVAAFQHILLPVAYEFCPELVLVSAGFDSARGDPKGLCDVSPEGFSHLTHMLMSLAGGNVVLVLEGGYNLTSVAESLCSCVATLLGDPCPMLEPLVASESAMESIANTLGVHSQYWSSLKRV